MRCTHKQCAWARTMTVVNFTIAFAIKGPMQGSTLGKRQVHAAGAIVQGRVHSAGQGGASADAQVQGEGKGQSRSSMTGL